MFRVSVWCFWRFRLPLVCWMAIRYKFRLAVRKVQIWPNKDHCPLGGQPYGWDCMPVACKACNYVFRRVGQDWEVNKH